MLFTLLAFSTGISSGNSEGCPVGFCWNPETGDCDIVAPEEGCSEVKRSSKTVNLVTPPPIPQ